MKLYKFGWPFRLLYPDYIWRKKTVNKELYLTFDDGPIPEVTEYVLDLLKEKGVKATFFCVGENITKHPEVYHKILQEGHRTGNHTYNHLKGFDTPIDEYVANVNKCNEVITEGAGRKLFRPPYGKIRRQQAKELKQQYDIVMWDVLANDFMKSVSADECLQKSVRYTRPGSIVLFHDSIKTFEKIKEVLPKYIDHFLAQGYNFIKL